MVGAAASTLPACAAGPASAKRLPRLGLYQGTDPPDPALVPLLTAFHEGLRDFGWIEDKTIQIDRRYTLNRSDRFDEIAHEFTSLPVDVIASSAAAGVRAAMKATTTIPIVMLLGSDPVENGFVQSLARPGGNVTGMASIGSVVTVKRLELLREAFPGISRVAILGDGDPIRQPQVKETEQAARGLKLDVVQLTMDTRDASSLQRALDLATASAADALLVLNVPTQIGEHRKEILGYAASNKIPAAYPNLGGWFEDGGLIATGEDGAETFRSAARFVDRVLKGAHPADLPIEQPTHYALLVNLRSARELGLTIPPSILGRATQVIQ